MTRRAIRGLLAIVVLFGAISPFAGSVVAADGPEFERGVEQTTQDETAEIDVAVPDGTDGPMTVRIGSEAVNFVANATVVDADGDGTVRVRLDTATAGSEAADSYLSVLGGDELRSADHTTQEIEPPLDEGDYDLSLWFDGEQVDVGTLIVAARPTTRSGDAAGTSFDYRGERLILAAAEGQVVRGETTLDPGTSVTVRMRSSGANPFLKSVETTVTERGTFETTFDLSDVPEGSHFELAARANGSRLASTEGRIACENDCPTVAPTGSPTTFGPTTDGTDGGPLDGFGALGAMALGAVLAVVGVGVLLGVFRS